MADAVTYAELRFSHDAATRGRHEGPAPEQRSEEKEIMYENVAGLETGKKRRALPSNPKLGAPLASGSLERFRLLCLILLLLCLCLLAAVIGLAVKYVQTTHDLHLAETKHQTNAEQMSSQEEHLESVRKKLETTKAELEKTRLHLERADLGNMDLNRTLMQCESVEQNCRNNTQIMKEELTDTMKILNQLERDLCPKGWVLFRNKCLWISDLKESWYNSKFDCEQKSSNLIIVEEDDQQLKDLLSKNEEVFWVGKKWNKKDKEWQWHQQPNLKNYCWQIGKEKLGTSYCWNASQWICEKNLVVASRVENNVHSLAFNLWGSNIWCHSEK